jgi:hypothetical protein
MTIKPISECPNPLNGIYNPPDELKHAAGYRVMPDPPPVQDGYTRVSIIPIEGDGVSGAWEVIDRSKAEMQAEWLASDLANNGTRYTLQNQYMTLCGQLTGQAPCRLGFAELQAIVEGMMTTDPTTAMGLSVRLLTLNAALVREGGLQWWDNCVWTEGLK